jgi:hypothetical protein
MDMFLLYDPLTFSGRVTTTCPCPLFKKQWKLFLLPLLLISEHIMGFYVCLPLLTNRALFLQHPQATQIASAIEQGVLALGFKREAGRNNQYAPLPGQPVGYTVDSLFATIEALVQAETAVPIPVSPPVKIEHLLTVRYFSHSQGGNVGVSSKIGRV